MKGSVNVFISAENPSYQKLPDWENARRMAALFADLVALGVDAYPATFYDKTSGYTENSYYVENIPLVTAIKLARYYGQESILVDGLGVLNVKTLMLAPQRKKYVGAKARMRPAYSVIGEKTYVSYDLDFDHQRPFTLRI